MPSADFSVAVRIDRSILSQNSVARDFSKGTMEISQGKTRNFQCVDAGFIKHTPLQMEDFVVTCPLVPSVPHLRSGSCTSPRIFGLGFLQTPPHDDALALLLTLGSANTWYEDFHLTSYVPCLAHTPRLSSGLILYQVTKDLYIKPRCSRRLLKADVMCCIKLICQTTMVLISLI